MLQQGCFRLCVLLQLFRDGGERLCHVLGLLYVYEAHRSGDNPSRMRFPFAYKIA